MGEAVAASSRRRGSRARPRPGPSAHPVGPGPAMIKAILIFNNHGKPRLSKFYQPYVSIAPRAADPREWGGKRASAGAGQRPAGFPQSDPRDAAALPASDSWPPLPVSPAGGSRLPLPAGGSPSVGEAVCAAARGAAHLPGPSSPTPRQRRCFLSSARSPAPRVPFPCRPARVQVGCFFCRPGGTDGPLCPP